MTGVAGPGKGVTVHAVVTARDLGAAEGLFREYAAGLPESAQVSLAHQGFEGEMSSLPGKYAGPAGCIMLARLHGTAVGVVALRPLDLSGVRAGDPTPICEMKRMYVKPSARGLGAGRALAAALIDYARAAGYRMMKLDTEPDFSAAIAVYRSLGFSEVPRYNDDPVSCTLWMGLRL